MWYTLCAEDQVLQEFRRVRQEPRAYRRLFRDEYFDLYLWYRRRWGRFVGFQLVYGKHKKPHALTWTKREGYRHESIDDGEDPGRSGHPTAPILVPDGAVDCVALADRFLQASTHLPGRVRAFVHAAILRYGQVGERG